MVRPILKRYFSGAVLKAAQGLPHVGQHILQKTVIKIAIPGVGIPLAIAVNRWSTFLAGKHARAVFRTEARIIEKASRLSMRTEHPTLLLWVVLLVINCDRKISERETVLLKHLTRVVHEQHGVSDDDLTKVVALEPDDVWERIASTEGNLDDIVAAAQTVAEIDGPINAREKKLLEKLKHRCSTERGSSAEVG